MRFLYSITAASVVVGNAMVSALFTPQLNPSCARVPETISQMDLEGSCEDLKTELCSHGCKVSASDYEKFFKAAFFSPAIYNRAKGLGIPDHSQLTYELIDEIYDQTKEMCDSTVEWEDDVCEEQDLGDFAECFQENIWSCMLQHGDKNSTLSGSACQVYNTYFGDDVQWRLDLRDQISNFTETCPH